jgi:hypothetical protein
LSEDEPAKAPPEKATIMLTDKIILLMLPPI